MDTCTKLQRLFLSYNEIQSLSDIHNISSVISLQEFTLDNNPISNYKNYKRNVIGQLLSLKTFDAKRINVKSFFFLLLRLMLCFVRFLYLEFILKKDEEKRNAERALIKEEYKRRDMENLVMVEVRIKFH